MRFLRATAVAGSRMIGGGQEPGLLDQTRRELSEVARIYPGFSPDERSIPPKALAPYRALR